jgi:hypothetical protein
LRWPYLALLVVLGCVLLWLLLSRANAPEEGGVREGRRGVGGGGTAFLVAWAAAGVASSPDARGERTRRETERTVLEYQADELGAAEAETFSVLLDRGVQDVEALVGPSLPPWAKRTDRIRYVVSARVPMSRTHGTTVLLPLERVRAHAAPYLHETVHALVPGRGDRIWLSEGLASYLESWVSENRSGYDAHIFTRAGDRGIHAAALRTLEREGGRAVLPWVGTHGEPPLMEEDRSGVARPFYVLSQSLTKYIVDGAGLGAVVRALVEGSAAGAPMLGGRTDEEWKRDWMTAIKAGPAPPG